MKWVTSSQGMQEIEQDAIERIGLPGICLMENAAKAVAMAIHRHHPASARCGVVVVCGAGNNGGDGYAVARWLQALGYPVSIWSLSTESNGDAAEMRAIATRCGIPTVTGLSGAALIVDAIFGIGLSREVTGRYAEVIGSINQHPSPVVAIDLPSGILANTGQPYGCAIRATRTVTFQHLKPCHVTAPGTDFCGTTEVVELGLSGGVSSFCGEIPEHTDLCDLWPVREKGAHKNQCGNLLIIAGSLSMAGAGVLAAMGALASGAGLVTLAAPRGALVRLAQLPPEVMLIESGEGDRLTPLPDAAFDRRTAVLAGPGLGGGYGDLPRKTAQWLRELWSSSSLPLVYDADALTCIGPCTTGIRAITPHPGEAGRILGCSPADIQRDRFEAANRLAALRCTALLKGPHTLVAHPGHPVSVNTTGNQILATAGSGDVLAGMVAALLAQGIDSRDACRLAAHVHGSAADRLRGIRTNGWVAGDVCREVPAAVDALMNQA